MSLQENQARNMVIGQLETNAITTPSIKKVLFDVPREFFVPIELKNSAYIDQDIEIYKNRFLLAPLTFAKLLELANITPSCRVLVIGCGNGYSTVILSELAGHVVSIDSDKELIAIANDNMMRLGVKDVNIKHVKNMADGYAMSAPYDVIFINGAVEYLPHQLATQLAIGGRLVAIQKVSTGLGKGILVKHMDGQVNVQSYFDSSSATLEGFEQKEKFTF
ncbi:MAG: protein-L-isoaspartate O-methyltransferase [Rickettsiales bacterium]